MTSGSEEELRLPLFLVGTRFQAMMAIGIIRHKNFAVYDLVVFLQDKKSPGENDLAFATLIRAARQVHYIDRGEPKLRFVRALNRAFGTRPRLVLTAWINNPFVLLLFRLRRRVRLQTFDEGSYNIAAKGPFFIPLPRTLRSLKDVVVRMLFPKGHLTYARARSECHFTAFIPKRNFMADRAVQVYVPWEDFALPEEVVQFEGSRRIMVLPCFKDFNGPVSVREHLFSEARECDLVVRHPRDAILPGLNSVRLSSPVEGIACALADQAPITLLHYASTVGQTLQTRVNIDLIDLSVPSRMIT